MAAGRRSRFAGGGPMLKRFADFIVRVGPYDDWRGWVRGLLVAAAVALFMAFSGAFMSEGVPFLRRLAYWETLMLLGATFGAFLVRGLFRGPQRSTHPWRNGVIAAVLMAIPYTGVVMVASRVMLGADMPLSALPVLFPSVLSVSMAMVAINILMETRRSRTDPQPAPPKFLERLPLKLRGAEVWAVEAEDHYLRLHTSKGQDLILLRLADAVAELDGIEGMQVHRSWWVARDAIADAKRGDGRAVLTLKDGSEVPVSRTYAGELRDKGWI